MGGPRSEAPSPPSAAGTLADAPLPQLLAVAFRKGWSGTFELRASNGEIVVITTEGGAVSRVRTSAPVAYLGSVLYEAGVIDAEQLNETLHRVASTGRLHGELLREAGAVTAEQLEQALSEQIARKLHHAATLPKGAVFRFWRDVDALAGRGHERLRVDPRPLIWRVVRERPPIDHMRATLARVELCKVREPRELSAFGFSSDELGTAELLALQPMSVAEVAASKLLRPEHAERLVYALALAGLIDATAPAPKQSTPRLAIGGPVSSAAPPSLHTSGLRRRLTPHATPRTAAPAPSASDPIRSDALGRLAVAERARRIGDEDHFQALGVDRDADGETIRAAFFRLCKVWHPDRLPPELRDLEAECARVFERLVAAHAALGDDEARRAYRASLEGAPADAELADVEGLLRDAETFLERGDVARAEERCNRACEAAPDDPAVIALGAWVLASPPHASPEVVSEAILALGRAIRLDVRCASAYFYRAELRRRGGALDLAIADYRRVVALDPRHVPAMRQLRLYEMRVRNGDIRAPRPAEKSSGFFAKLVGK